MGLAADRKKSHLHIPYGYVKRLIAEIVDPFRKYVAQCEKDGISIDDGKSAQLLFPITVVHPKRHGSIDGKSVLDLFNEYFDEIGFDKVYFDNTKVWGKGKVEVPEFQGSHTSEIATVRGTFSYL